MSEDRGEQNHPASIGKACCLSDQNTVTIHVTLFITKITATNKVQNSISLTTWPHC